MATDGRKDAEAAKRRRDASRNLWLVVGCFALCFVVFNLVSGGFSAGVDFFSTHAPRVSPDCPAGWSRGPFGMVCIEPVVP